MTSPFEGYQDFYEAEGPIYTFANNPTMIGILVVAAALVFVYFIYSTFTIKKGHSDAKNPAILGVLLVAGLVSMADSLYTHYTKTARPTAGVTQDARSAAQSTANSFQPLALLGLTTGGLLMSGGRSKRHRSKAKTRLTAMRRKRRIS